MPLQRSANAEKGSIQEIQPISRQSRFTQIAGGVVCPRSTFNAWPYRNCRKFRDILR
jgi:hypothetical protein